MFLKRFLAGAISFFCLAISAAQAQPSGDVVEIEAQITTVQGPKAYVVVSLTNKSPLIFEQMKFKCVFKREGKPVGVTEGFVHRLAPGQTETIQVSPDTAGLSSDHSCRPVQALVYF